MGQTKKGSFLESIVNVLVGFGVSMASNILLLNWFGVNISLSQQFQLTVIFTFISIGRSFILRRLFNWWTERQERACLK